MDGHKASILVSEFVKLSIQKVIIDIRKLKSILENLF